MAARNIDLVKRLMFRRHYSLILVKLELVLKVSAQAKRCSTLRGAVSTASAVRPLNFFHVLIHVFVFFLLCFPSAPLPISDITNNLWMCWVDRHVI